MRRRILQTVAILLVAFAAVSAWWWFGVNGVREAALGWAAERRAAGWTVAWDGLALGGFPLVWRLDVTDARLSLPGRVDFDAPRLSVRVVPWAGDSMRVTAPAARAAVFAGPAGAAYRADASALDIRIVRHGEGTRASVDLRTEATVVTRDGAVGRARAEAVALEIAPAAAADAGVKRDALRAPPLYAARLDVADISLSPNPLPELGKAIERARLDAVLHGSLGAGPLRAELARWRDGAGTVEIGRIDVAWGEVRLNGDATVALDERLQPLIAGTVTLNGYSEALSALVAQGLVRAEDAMAARLAFRLLRTSGSAAPRIPVTLQSGVLSLGPARVARLVPIAWPNFSF